MDEISVNAWYNAVPRAASGRGLADFTEPEKFYEKSNVLVIPAAKYPENRTGRPYFAVAMNSKLFGTDERLASSVRVQNMGAPARTVVFFESGLPDEKQLPGQPAYMARASGYATDVVARYGETSGNELAGKQTNIVFGDGHVETLSADAVIAPGGSAHYPQLEQYNGKGKVSWTLDPEANPNF
jgi:prepilin-type processing-associated H-X9-DG protein